MPHAAGPQPGALPPDYLPHVSAAYIAARMPGAYSVLHRIFDELRLQLSDFQPQTMLDFGSGPGTAIWAAREVCALGPCRALGGGCSCRSACGQGCFTAWQDEL